MSDLIYSIQNESTYSKLPTIAFSSPLGSEFVLCDGPSVCGSEHGLCGSVQGSGDLGRTNRVLDIAYHVAVDDQIPVEPLLGNFPYQKILRRHDAAPKRHIVRPCCSVASPTVVLRRYDRRLCRRCVQRRHARHRGRRRLHVGTHDAGSGEVYRLAGCVLQPCETGRHGRSGVACGVALRGVQHLGDRIVRRLCPFVDGRFAAPVRHARRFGPLPSPRASFRRFGFRRPLAAGWPFGPERGYRGVLHQTAYLVLPRIHHPLSSGRGLRDEDRAVVPQSRYGFGRSGPHEPADRPLLRDVRRRGFSPGLAAGGLLYRTPGPATHSFHIMLYL